MRSDYLVEARRPDPVPGDRGRPVRRRHVDLGKGPPKTADIEAACGPGRPNQCGSAEESVIRCVRVTRVRFQAESR
jgi:hypothetical protein